MTKKLAVLLVAVSGLSFVVGCATYRPVRVVDHGKRNLTELETLKTSKFLFWGNTEHQFWLCQETDDALNCDRQCGGSTDLFCPTASDGTVNYR